MKLGPVTKPDQRNKATSKRITITSCRQIVTSQSFFRFVASFEQSRGWIPDAQSVKLTFSFTLTFSLTKTKNRNKKLSSHTIALSEGYIFAQKPSFFSKKADISKTKRALVLKVCFLKLYVYVYLRAKFQVSSIILTSFRRGEEATGNFTA